MHSKIKSIRNIPTWCFCARLYVTTYKCAMVDELSNFISNRSYSLNGLHSLCFFMYSYDSFETSCKLCVCKTKDPSSLFVWMFPHNETHDLLYMFLKGKLRKYLDDCCCILNMYSVTLQTNVQNLTKTFNVVNTEWWSCEWNYQLINTNTGNNDSLYKWTGAHKRTSQNKYSHCPYRIC